MAALAALPLCAVMALTACEDSQSRAGRETAEKIQDALADARAALPGGRTPDAPEEALAAAEKLRGIAQSLSGIQSGSPGQKSAALLFASALNRQAAAIDLGVVTSLEGSHRDERLAVDRAAASAASLESLAVPLERIDFAFARTELKGQRDKAEAQLRQLQSEIKALEAAVSQVNRQIEASEQQASALDLQANQLRLEARSLPPAAALPKIEEAAALQNRNAGVRGALGRQQSERGAIAPQLAGAKALGAGGAAVLEVTDETIKELQALAESARDSASRAKKSASAVREAGKARLEAVLAAMTETLTPRYESAISALERSAALAGQAAAGASPDASDSAKISQAAAQMALARALWQRASALEDHATLLHRLDTLGGWGQSSQLEAAVTDVEATRKESTDKAKELYQSAIEALQSGFRNASRSDSPEVVGLRMQAEAALKQLSEPSSVARAAAAQSGGGAADGASSASGSGAGRGASSGEGAESPEALVDAINGATDPVAVVSLMRSAKAPEAIEMMKTMMGAIKPLTDACIGHFGLEAMRQAGGVGGGAPVPSGAKLISKSETSADLEMRGAQGMESARAVNVDGRWFIDFDSIASGAGPGLNANAMAQAGPMMSMMTQAMSSAATKVAGRVTAGEFADPAAAMAAFQKEMMAAMGAAMGGQRPPG